MGIPRGMVICVAFSFKSQLKFIIPVGKGSCRIQTLDTSANRGNIIDIVKFWFPMLNQIIRNARQGRLRAYHSLPDYYLLKYEELDVDNGRQKWRKVYRIKVYKDCTIELYDIIANRTYMYN